MRFFALTLEFIWIAAATACAVGASREFFAGDAKNGAVFCILSLISLVMYYLRRARRINNRNKNHE